MEKINALGEACPLPVIKAKKALAEHDTIEIKVDNGIATQNLKKMAEQKGYGYFTKQLAPQEYSVVISKTDLNPKSMNDQGASLEEEAYIVVIDANVMGRGDDQLGATLLKGFIYALTEQDRLPSRVIMYNGGVQFAVPTSESFEDLTILAKAGVEVYACGACTDYYGLTDQVGVGEITNMYRIIEMMREASRIVKP